MKYNVQIKQGKDSIFVGELHDETLKDKLIKDWEKVVEEANKNEIFSITTKNIQGLDVIIPKSILISSIIIISKVIDTTKKG